MLLVLVLIAWLSVSALAVLVCKAASHADDLADEATRAQWAALQSLARAEIPGDGPGPLVASRVPRAAALAVERAPRFLAGP